MVDLSWAQRALSLMDAALSVHGAAIGQLRASGVSEARIRALYPAVPQDYVQGVSQLIMTPKLGRVLLENFPTGQRDVRTTAAKLELLGDFEEQAELAAELSLIAERASVEYPGLGVAGQWGSILDFYAFPAVLHRLLITDPDRWDNWPPKNLAYLLSPFSTPAQAITELLG